MHRKSPISKGSLSRQEKAHTGADAWTDEAEERRLLDAEDGDGGRRRLRKGVRGLLPTTGYRFLKRREYGRRNCANHGQVNRNLHNRSPDRRIQIGRSRRFFLTAAMRHRHDHISAFTAHLFAAGAFRRGEMRVGKRAGHRRRQQRKYHCYDQNELAECFHLMPLARRPESTAYQGALLQTKSRNLGQNSVYPLQRTGIHPCYGAVSAMAAHLSLGLP